MTTKKFKILSYFDSHGPATPAQVHQAIDTEQTLAQVSSYISVLRNDDHVVEYNPTTMKWSITEEGEKYLQATKPATPAETTSQPARSLTKKSAILGTLSEASPINIADLHDLIEPETGQTKTQLGKMLDSLRVNGLIERTEHRTWQITEKGRQSMALAGKTSATQKTEPTVTINKTTAIGPTEIASSNQDNGLSDVSTNTPTPKVKAPKPATDQALQELAKPVMPQPEPERSEIEQTTNRTERVTFNLVSIASHAVDKALGKLGINNNPKPRPDVGHIKPADIAEHYSYNVGNAIDLLMDKYPSDQVDYLLMAKEHIEREISRLEAG